MKTKLLAVLVVLVMAFAGVAVAAEQSDAAAGDAAPTSFAADATSGMKVIAYVDKVIMIDTNDMAGIEAGSNFIVGLTPSEGTELKIGPIASVNGRLYIDGNGNDLSIEPKALLTAGSATAVNLYAYGVAGSAAIGTASLTYSATKATVNLLTNHSDAWAHVNYEVPEIPTEEAPAYTTYTNVVADRNSVHPLDIYLGTEPAPTTDQTAFNTAFNGYNYGYILDGFATTYNGNVQILPTTTIKVEDLIFEMYNSGIETPITVADGKITLYAKWSAAVLNMYVAATNASITAGTTTLESLHLTTVGDVKVTDKIGEATVTAIVQKGDFAVLNVKQTAASVNNYIYTFTLYKVDQGGILQATTYTEPGAEGNDYDYKILNNGIYKFTGMKTSMVIVVTATAASTIPVTAYSFGFDSVNNDAAASTGGQARLSLDLFDYTASADQNIAVKGTYFKTIGEDTATKQRVYGNIDNMTFTATNMKGFIDLAPEVLSEEELAAKQMTLTADGTVFDLEIDLGANVSIYAAQGVWDQTATDGGEVYTPWSLYKETTA